MIAWGAPFSAGAGYFVRPVSKPRQSLARGLPAPPVILRLVFLVITRLDRVIHFILDPLVKPEDDQRNARRVTGGASIKTYLPARPQARTAGRMGALRGVWPRRQKPWNIQIDLPPCTFQVF